MVGEDTFTIAAKMPYSLNPEVIAIAKIITHEIYRETPYYKLYISMKNTMSKNGSWNVQK